MRGRKRVTLAVVSVSCAAALHAQQITLESISNSGVQADGNCSYPSLSGDGRFIAFSSNASSATLGGGNALASVYRRDRATGQLVWVSYSISGQPPNSGAWTSLRALSYDGRFVVFSSDADNMGTPDTPITSDVFLRDMQTGQLTLISVKPDGTGGVGDSFEGLISSDGRYVVFTSEGPNLVANDNNHRQDVFVRDVLTATTTRVSVSSSGAESNGRSHFVAITPDARYIAFTSLASNLVTGDTNGDDDVFVHDRVTGQTVLASQSTSGAAADSDCLYASISADGRYVVFESRATTLATIPTGIYSQSFLRDLVAGTTTWICNVGPTTNASTSSPVISSDGSKVIFLTKSNQLGYPQPPTPLAQIYEQDLATGTFRLVSAIPNGQPGSNNSDYHYGISDDGRCVCFASSARDLVANDLNNFIDIFVDGGPWCGTVQSYCTPGTSSNGCVATLSASGTASVSAASGFTLSASNVEGLRTGLIFYGVNGPAQFAWGQGSSYLCVKSPTQRTGAQNSGGTSGLCDGSLSLDWLAFAASHPGALGAPFAAGDVVWAQAWYRDPPGAKSTALSDALSFTLCP